MATRPVVCSITMNFQELPVPERGTFRLLDNDIPDDLRNYLNAHIFGFIQPPITVSSYVVDVYDYEDRPGGTIDIDVTVRVPLTTTNENIEQFIDNEIFAKDINVNIFTDDYPITRGTIMQGGKRRSKRVKQQKSKRKSKGKSKGKSTRKSKR